jgi:signal transduction histidine kinase
MSPVSARLYSRWWLGPAILLFFASAPALAESARLVVVLYPEADNASPGSILANRGLRTTFAGGAGERPIEVHNEFLEVSRYPDPTYQRELAQFLARKYSGRKVDLLIAGLSSGLDFALAHRDKIFPGAPLVFMAVDRDEIDRRKLPKDVVGTPIRMDLAASLDTALDIRPQTRHLFVIVGKSQFDQAWGARAESAFAQYADRVQITFLTGLPLENLRAKVQQLPADSLIYYLHVFEDRDGRIYVPADVVGEIAPIANAPIFSHVDTYLGRGVVGGRVFSFEQAGRDAAEVGLRIFAGEEPSSIGIRPTSPSTHLFDARELARWRIAPASLPAGSEIRFQEPTMWQRYKWQFSSLAAICLVQGGLITFLLVQRDRQQRAEKQRRHAESQLEANREELRKLAGQILGAQELERRRIARELHDDFGQGLALLSVELDLLRQRSEGISPEAQARMEAMSGRVKELSSSIHDLSHQLHPMKLEQLGLVAAMRGLTKEIAQSHKLPIDFRPEEVPAAIPPDVALCLYRVTQEALRNVVRHSGATSATVVVSALDSRLSVSVTDNGKGFHYDGANSTGGLGLVSMRERLRLAGGELAVSSQDGEGTRLEAFIPLGGRYAADVKSNAPASSG